MVYNVTNGFEDCSIQVKMSARIADHNFGWVARDVAGASIVPFLTNIPICHTVPLAAKWKLSADPVPIEGLGK